MVPLVMANNNGAHRFTRTNLAVLLREKFHEQIIFDWLVEVMAGHNPAIVKDARCVSTGGFRVTVPEGRGYIPATLEQKFRAMEILLQRRDGMPAQHVHLEAEVRAQLAQGTGTVDRGALAGLPLEKLMALRELLRPELPAGPSDAASAPASDAVEGVLAADSGPDEPLPARTQAENDIQDAELVENTDKSEE